MFRQPEMSYPFDIDNSPFHGLFLSYIKIFIRGGVND